MAKPDFSLLDSLDAPAPAPLTASKPAGPDFSMLDNLEAAAPTPAESGKVGLSGPGSSDPAPTGPITTSVPRHLGTWEGIKGTAGDVAGGVKNVAVDGAKSAFRGGSVLASIFNDADGKSGIIRTLADGSKRRELERGVSDVTTLGLAEKTANIFPDYAASAEPDAKNAPGFRDAGGLAGMVLPNAPAEAASVAATGVRATGARILSGPLNAAGKGSELGPSISKALSVPVEKRIAEQGVADVVGTTDPLVGAATITDRKKVLKGAAIDKSPSAPYGALGKELITPEGRTITDLARTDPDEALKKLNKLVDKIHAPAAGDYKAIDEAVGGFRVAELHKDILDHIKKIERPANETTENEFKKLAQSIENKWSHGTRGDMTVPGVGTFHVLRSTSDLRRLVTDLREVASNTLGSLKESEGFKVREELASVAFDSLNKHLDEAAAKGGPGIKAAVERVRESNKRVAALLSLQDALKTRIIKTNTLSMTKNSTKAAGAAVGTTLGTGIGAAIGHGLGGTSGALLGGGIGGAVGGITGRAVGAPVVRGIQATDRLLARVALAKLRDPHMGPAVEAAVKVALQAGVPQDDIDNTLSKVPGQNSSQKAGE